MASDIVDTGRKAARKGKGSPFDATIPSMAAEILATKEKVERVRDIVMASSNSCREDWIDLLNETAGRLEIGLSLLGPWRESKFHRDPLWRVLAPLNVIALGFVVGILAPAVNWAYKRFPPWQKLILVTYGAGVVAAVSAIFFFWAIRLRQSFWIKSHLTQGLVHEIKSPLGVIRSAAEFIEGQVARNERERNKQAEYTEMILRNTERLEKCVIQLLDLIKIQDGRAQIRKEPFDLRSLAQSVMRDHQEQARLKGIAVVCNPGDPIAALGDPEKINQVFSNLLSNALKYSDEGTIHIDFRDHGDGKITCAVKDEGKGIERTELAKIFVPFYQVNGSKGSGIGLSIAKGWVEAHGGKMWVESKGLGFGTTFLFTLPLAQSAVAGSRKALEPNPSE